MLPQYTVRSLGLPAPVPLGAHGPVVVVYLASALAAGSLDQYDLGLFVSFGLRLSHASVCSVEPQKLNKPVLCVVRA